jgi:hypothetical protein
MLRLVPARHPEEQHAAEEQRHVERRDERKEPGKDSLSWRNATKNPATTEMTMSDSPSVPRLAERGTGV